MVAQVIYRTLPCVEYGWWAAHFRVAVIVFRRDMGGGPVYY